MFDVAAIDQPFSQQLWRRLAREVLGLQLSGCFLPSRQFIE
jgi:hypothetical protein